MKEEPMACSRQRIALLFAFASLVPGLAIGAVERRQFTATAGYLVVEVLDDDLVHFEASAVGSPPSLAQPLFTSPMVLKKDYGGPSTFTDGGLTLETPAMRLIIEAASLCVRVEDKARGNAHLSTICPLEMDKPFKGIDLDPTSMTQVYGLGQQFTAVQSPNCRFVQATADGDWIAHGVREGMVVNGLDAGNGFQGLQCAAVGNVQIPVLYAVGTGGLNYALFMDNVYKQRWDFTGTPWKARMYGDQLRWYVMTGPDLPDLRADYMELTGRPPVPPRKAFGLWVSEFGYDNFGQIDNLLAGLRSNDFQVDGFVLDLNWFGGVVNNNNQPKTHMGRLNWDEDQSSDLKANPYSFQNPGAKVKSYAADHIGLTAIEESYLANTTDTFQQMPANLTAYRPNSAGVCDGANQTQAVTDISGFWGTGRMIDWTDPAARSWIHDNRRFPNLSKPGITSHWTDLGEPETFSAAACYDGVETTISGRKNHHSDVHNLYNLLWNQAIWDGYVAKQGQVNDLGVTNPRPFIVTRSGAAGTQRTGAAMWSGDIASATESLAAHFNAQLHMSFSGIDYHGSDLGGFRREVLPHNDKQGSYRGYEDELFTQWFAAGAWFDVPVRPHTDNEFVNATPPYDTAPDRVGHVRSNRANLRQRYALIPYYYSLAHRAHAAGEPVVPPLVFYYQNDANVRGLGHEKLIGRDLLVGVVAQHGEYERDVYLPSGRWANFHTGEWVTSSGQWIRNIPAYRNGVLTLPAFARAGAIFPMMAVDKDTKDAFGNRKGGAAPRSELIARVYADSTPSGFTLFEDDGTTLQYDAAGRPSYHHRTTRISQQQTGSTTVTVTVAAATNVNGPGPYPGAVTSRQNVVELVVDALQATAVSLNGSSLTQHANRAAFDAAASGWINAGRNLIFAKSASLDVATVKTFVFVLQATGGSTSINFVCDNAFTAPGQTIYAVGSIPELGNWNPSKAIALNPSIYWEYIYNPPAAGSGPGPSKPIWTGVLDGLPSNPNFEWKCIRRNEDGSGSVVWQPGPNTAFSAMATSGYAGRTYGKF
jgi:alpha-glucosidase (family GH31 glycosyl hydrolase)